MLSLLLLALQAPPDEAACLAWVRKVEASIAKDDGTAADAEIDVEALLDRAFKDTPGDEKNKAGFRQGIRTSFKLCSPIARAVRDGDGSYRFLRLRTEGAARRAVFRLIANDSFNYHDFLLEAGPGGAVRATDVHILLSGEWMSETFRRSYLGFVSSQPGLLGKLTGKQNQYVKTLAAVQSMAKLKQEGKAAEALKVYDGLSAEGKKDKMALLARYQAAQDAALDLLPAVLKDFEANFPGDASLPALSIDAHFAARRFPQTLGAIDAVEKSVGGDPNLDVLRAAVHQESGAMDKAKAAALKAIEREPGLAGAYWTLVTISLREKRYPDTVKWLDAVEKDLGLKIQDLEGNELYADFVKSPEHREWLKGRTK